MKVEIERERCISSGNCVLVSPNVFDQDDHAIVRLHTDTVDEPDVASVEEAVEGCPAAAISIT